MANTLTTRKEIEKAIINFVKETDNDVLELIYNEYFNEPIAYCEDSYFEISNAEAERVGIETLK